MEYWYTRIYTVHMRYDYLFIYFILILKRLKSRKAVTVFLLDTYKIWSVLEYVPIYL